MLSILAIVALLILGYIVFGTIWTVAEFIIAVVVWALIGFLAGQITRGRGFGLLGNVVVGLVGAYVGALIFWALGIGFVGAMPLLGGILVGTVGAVVVVVLFNLLTGRRRLLA